MSRRRRRGARRPGPAVRYPIGMVATYGPDDRTVTKLVASVMPGPDTEPTALRRWAGTKVASDPQVKAEVDEFLRSQGAKTKMTAVGVLGCPHEEGEDFPEGDDCPFCPFWKGMQGSSSASDERWRNLKRFEIEYL